MLGVSSIPRKSPGHLWECLGCPWARFGHHHVIPLPLRKQFGIHRPATVYSQSYRGVDVDGKLSLYVYIKNSDRQLYRPRNHEPPIDLPPPPMFIHRVNSEQLGRSPSCRPYRRKSPSCPVTSLSPSNLWYLFVSGVLVQALGLVVCCLLEAPILAWRRLERERWPLLSSPTAARSWEWFTNV